MHFKTAGESDTSAVFLYLYFMYLCELKIGNRQ